MRPRRWARNSSASTEVLEWISTRSMAMVGISASMVRRRELASARVVLLRTKSMVVALVWDMVLVGCGREGG